jgi:hypothetical protein
MGFFAGSLDTHFTNEKTVYTVTFSTENKTTTYGKGNCTSLEYLGQCDNIGTNPICVIPPKVAKASEASAAVMGFFAGSLDTHFTNEKTVYAVTFSTENIKQQPMARVAVLPLTTLDSVTILEPILFVSCHPSLPRQVKSVPLLWAVLLVVWTHTFSM